MSASDSRVAVITGAGGGIGGALSRELAGRGYQLALVDVNAEALQGTASRVREVGGEASLHPADLSDPAAVERVAGEAVDAHGHVDVLVNNAGVAMIGGFQDLVLKDFEWLFAVNFWAAVRLSKLLLPHLHTRPRGQIVNVSSVFGLIAPEGQTAYASSKFALRGFSEALRHELQGSRVSVTVVHPGGVRTGIAGSARRSPGISEGIAAQMAAEFRRTAKTTPEKAARVIAKGIERRARRVLVGFDAALVDRIQRWAPVRYPAVLGLMIRVLTGRRPTSVADYGQSGG